MIHKDEIEIKGIKFDHVYSDLSVYIHKIKLGGIDETYTECYDPIKWRDIWKYEETDRKIDETEQNGGNEE